MPKQASLSNLQKGRIVAKFDEGLTSQTGLAQWATKEFKRSTPLSQSSISRIISKRVLYSGLMTLKDPQANHSVVKFPELEHALNEWILQCNHRNVFLVCLQGLQHKNSS